MQYTHKSITIRYRKVCLFFTTSVTINLQKALHMNTFSFVTKRSPKKEKIHKLKQRGGREGGGGSGRWKRKMERGKKNREREHTEDSCPVEPQWLNVASPWDRVSPSWFNAWGLHLCPWCWNMPHYCSYIWFTYRLSVCVRTCVCVCVCARARVCVCVLLMRSQPKDKSETSALW